MQGSTITISDCNPTIDGVSCTFLQEEPEPDSCEISNSFVTLPGGTFSSCSPPIFFGSPTSPYRNPSTPSWPFGPSVLSDEIASCLNEQAREDDRDSVANDLADQIRDLHAPEFNPDNNEYGSLILELDNGEIVGVSPTEGLTGQISLTRLMQEAQSSYPGVNMSNVVGVLHSHPSTEGPGFVSSSSISDLGDTDYGSTMPSHVNLSGDSNRDDWAAVQSFLLSDGTRSDVDDVTQFILGPDGTLREYDYSDGHPSESAEQHGLIDAAEKDGRNSC